jgi:hypothetical protein
MTDSLCIKWNSSNHNASCGLCHEPVLVSQGPALFVEGAGSPVCIECGSQSAPELTAMLDHYFAAVHAAEAAAATADPFGDDGQTNVAEAPDIAGFEATDDDHTKPQIR